MRDLKFEYSQLESDSGEAYNLRSYLWQDSKAATREGPQDIVGAKQLYLAQAGSANVGGVVGRGLREGEEGLFGGWRRFDRLITCTNRCATENCCLIQGHKQGVQRKLSRTVKIGI